MTTLFSPWFVSLLQSDAGAAWAAGPAPVLGLFGGKDVQVPALSQAPALQAALDGGRQPGRDHHHAPGRQPPVPVGEYGLGR